MIALFLVLSVFFMVVGHIFKVKRWGLFISVYEQPADHNLLNALAVGHTINAILPIRLGDIVRVIWSGRRLKNGGSFALATVIVDLYIDTVTVGCLFVAFSLLGLGGSVISNMARFYIYILGIIIFLTVFSIVFRRIIKKTIHGIAGIFNEKIEFKLLYITYLCIASLKDIFKNISRIRFVLYTAAIWCGYLASYTFFSYAINEYGYTSSTFHIFAALYSGMNLFYVDRNLLLLWGSFILLPLAGCWLLSKVLRNQVMRKGYNEDSSEYKLTLPQMNQADRLAFLRTYYEEDNREHLQAYLGINSDVTVVEDHSAGSNASTVLVLKHDGNLYFRKYAFDEDSSKLLKQIEWIEKHQSDIPLPVIVERQYANNYIAYDMHSYGSAMGLFRYIHTMPVENSWTILERALKDIEAGIHAKNAQKAAYETIELYVQDKVLKNIKIIEEDDKYIKNLEQNEYIIVNGKKLRTLKFYHGILQTKHLIQIFKNDCYSDIHGDLIIENIICLRDHNELSDAEYKEKVRPESYYFIDPNTGNVHNSPFLDYAKLLQSLHGCYEFLMMVSSVKIEKNQINYMITKSEAYRQLYEKYKIYLKKTFSKDEMISIYFHEVVHWLRLMPYKIRKDEKLAVVFYTGLLDVLNDVWEMENGY